MKRRLATLAVLLSTAGMAAIANESEALTSSPKGPGRDLPRPAPHLLSLGWFDAVQVQPLVRQVAHREVESILRGIGVEVLWKTVPSDVVDVAQAGDLQVILLPVEPSSWGLSKRAMGAVMHSGPPARVLYIFFPNVIRTLGFTPVGDTRFVEASPHETGRALGRVIVHELIHAIAPEHPHAPDGLLRGRLSRFHLLRGDLDVDDACTEAFLSRLAPSQEQLPPHSHLPMNGGR